MNKLAHFARELKSVSIPLSTIQTSATVCQDISWQVLRLDLLDAQLSGNKAFKLLPVLMLAQALNKNTLMSFGGAHSNHLHALSWAGRRYGFKTVGIVQAYKNQPLTPTLKEVLANGMQLIYVDKSEYRMRHQEDYRARWKRRFGDALMIPEGAADDLGLEGAKMMAQVIHKQLHLQTIDFLCISAGTGTTALGISDGKLFSEAKIQVFSALNAEYVTQLESLKTIENVEVIDTYCLSGFASINAELAVFINDFESQQGVPLDPVYTAKMMYGINDLINKNYYPKGSHIICLHTGGLQGMAAMREKIMRLTASESAKTSSF